MDSWGTAREVERVKPTADTAPLGTVTDPIRTFYTAAGDAQPSSSSIDAVAAGDWERLIDASDRIADSLEAIAAAVAALQQATDTLTSQIEAIRRDGLRIRWRDGAARNG